MKCLAGFTYAAYSSVHETVPVAGAFIEGYLYLYGSLGTDFLPQATFAEGWLTGFTFGCYTYYCDDVGGDELDYSFGQIDLSKDAREFGYFSFWGSLDSEDSGNDEPIFWVSWGKEWKSPIGC